MRLLKSCARESGGLVRSQNGKELVGGKLQLVKDPASMSELRFRNVLRAERQFMADLPMAARWAYRLRLGLRALRLAPRAPALSSLALRACLSVRG